MEAPAFYNLDSTAGRGKLEAVVADVADELGIPTPQLLGDPPSTVALPPHPDRVQAALDTACPDWR